ncbi:MAG: hypothetical protein ACRCX2_20440 [Paraclostridium sp.]
MRDLKHCIGNRFKRACDIRYGWVLLVNGDGKYILKSDRGTGCCLEHIKGSGSWDFTNEEQWHMEGGDDFWNV